MGGIVDSIFGSTESPSVSQATTQTPEQQALLKKLSELLQGQLGTGVESYPGDMTAGPSGLQTQAWNEISRLMSGGKSGSSTEAVNRILQGSDVGEFDPAAIQDWYKNALVNPAMAEWEKNVAPVVQEKFIGQNAGSSGAANRAIAGSAEDLMTNLNAQLAAALYGEKGAYDTRKFTAGQSDLNRATAVPGMESTSTIDFLKTLGMGTDAGATQQALNQTDINELISKWTTEQPYNNPWLNLLANALGTTSFENVVDPGSRSSGLMQDFMPAIAGWAGSDTGSETISGWLGGLFGGGGNGWSDADSALLDYYYA